jgi:hypothetical protein
MSSSEPETAEVFEEQYFKKICALVFVRKLNSSDITR